MNIVKATFIMILMLAWCAPVWGFEGGDGSPENPYKVADADDLAMVGDGINGQLDDYYIQIIDIDLSTYANWEPIAGNDPAEDDPVDIFTGSYDGQNYTISNLAIDRPDTDNVGLFGHVGEGAVIKNVRLENVDVQGRRGVGSLVGRVTGDNQTLISRCYAGGDTVNTVVSFNGVAGGLVGSNNSVQETPGGEDNPVISQCYANIDVSLSGTPAAGDTRTKKKFGGLAGCNQKGTIMDSYARGSVTVENAEAERVGGLAGCVEFRGRVLRSYSTGLVTAHEDTDFVGGLVGRVGTGGNAGIVEDSYWDMGTSGQTTSSGGEGKTTNEMKDQATFVDWDFDTIWDIDDTEAINDGYPFLRFELLDGEGNAITWEGGTNSDWNEAENWNPEQVPGPSDNVTIPDATANDLVIYSTVIAETNDLTIDANATLTIESDDTNTGALIIQGTFSGPGELIVERYLDDDRWYITGPPVIGQEVEPFLAGNDIPSQDIDGFDYYGATIYDEPNNKWDDYFEVNVDHGEFDIGTGYMIRRAEDGVAGGTVNFTGAPETGSVDVPVTVDGFRWNAVGNPYTAAIGVTGSASTAQNFLFANFEKLDPSHVALYIWHEPDNDVDGYYVIANNAGFSNAFIEDQLDMDYIQLGQGFIIRAAAEGEVTFTPDMRKGHPEIILQSPLMAGQPVSAASSTDSRWPGAVVSATTADGAKDTAGITFHESMSLGMDAGYDAGVFKVNNPKVAIYTRLASGDDGVDYGLQCLPTSAMDWISLSLGLETRSSGTVTLRFETSGLPDDTTVILEDTKEQSQKTITDSDNTYTTTVDASDGPYGRFYLSFGEADVSDPPSDDPPSDDPPSGDPPDDDDPPGDRDDVNDGSSGSSGSCFINTAAP